MLKLLEEGDLSDGGGGDALIVVVKADALDGDDLVGVLVAGLVDDAVGALANLGHALVLLYL